MRRIRIVLLWLLGLCAVVIVAGIFIVQTEWFRAQVRDRIVSLVEQTTGGKVELQSFFFDWHTLTAKFQNFVIRGSEPASGMPLYRADLIVVRLKIISVFKRDVDVDSVVVDRPQIYIVAGSDGTTNLPIARTRYRRNGTVPEQILKLKVRQFALRDGTIRTDLRSVPLEASGEHLQLTAKYDGAADRYDLDLESKQLHFASDDVMPFAGDLAAQVQFEKDGLRMPRFSFLFAGSKIEGKGELLHFARPVVDAQIKAELLAGPVGKIVEFPKLQAGEISLNGDMHYDQSSSIRFRGSVRGRKLNYHSRSFSLSNFSVDSPVYADRKGVTLNRVFAMALGSRISGEASIESYRTLRFAGKINDLDVRRIGPYLTDRPVPWSGVAAGTFRTEGTLSHSKDDFIIQSKVAITPGAGGIPLSGDVDVTYKEHGDVVEFGESHLQFPNSQLTASGVFDGRMQVVWDATDLADLKPAMQVTGTQQTLPLSLENGKAHFDGVVTGSVKNPQVDGNVAITHFRAQTQLWDQFRAHVGLSASSLDLTSLTLDQSALHATGSGHFGLRNWAIGETSPVRLQADFHGADIVQLLSRYTSLQLPIVKGVAAGSMDIQGTLDNPSGSARVNVDSLDAYGERLSQIQIASTMGGNQVQITQGRVQAGPAAITFSGAYRHDPGNWTQGVADIKVDSNGFPLASSSIVRKYEPGLNAQFEIHAKGTGRLTRDQVEPSSLDGTVTLRHVSMNQVDYGNLALTAATHGQTVDARFTGDLRNSQLSGETQVQLKTGYPAQGKVQLGRIKFSTLYALARRDESARLPFDGFLQGGCTFAGSLQNFAQMRATAHIEELQVTPNLSSIIKAPADRKSLLLQNRGPILLELADDVVTVQSFQLGDKDSSVTVKGRIPFTQQRPLDVRADGSINLQVFALADPNVQAAGVSTVAASVGGTLRNPTVNGMLEIKNGSFFLNNFPNGLSGVNGTVRFDRNRATIQKVTARSGGGEIGLTGFISFGAGPVVYQVSTNATDVRVRYAGGISVTTNSLLKFTGTSDSSLLAGSVTVTKVSFNPSTDVGNLLAATTAPIASPSNQRDFLQGIQFDVHVESAPNLQLSTSLSQDVEAEIDLRLRGSPDRPAVLGRISVDQGDIKVFGTKYTINRGEVNFFSPAKIEPVLDLDLQTQTRGITVNITVSGPVRKLNINYRSDPPLQPRDIIALLAVGRPPDAISSSSIASTQVTHDSSTLQAGGNTLLGQAISPVSNRLSRLFGITNIKIDPLVQGLTNTPQSRLTVEQQISRDITVTYVTNLQQTSEQIFRFEWSVNRQYSITAVRDDNGEFGIDIQFKKRFK